MEYKFGLTDVVRPVSVSVWFANAYMRSFVVAFVRAISTPSSSTSSSSCMGRDATNKSSSAVAPYLPKLLCSDINAATGCANCFKHSASTLNFCLRLILSFLPLSTFGVKIWNYCIVRRLNLTSNSKILTSVDQFKFTEGISGECHCMHGFDLISSFSFCDV